MPNYNSIFWNPELAKKASKGPIQPLNEDEILLEKLSQVLESGDVEVGEEESYEGDSFESRIARFASTYNRMRTTISTPKVISKQGEATFMEMPGTKAIVNPPVQNKEMEIKEVEEEDLPSKFAVGVEVVHLPSKRYGVVVSHATDLPLMAIVQFTDKSIELVDMRELVLVSEFEHELNEVPVFDLPGKPNKEEEAERILEQYRIQHVEVENPVIEKMERVREAIKAVITDPLVAQKIVTYLTENGVLNIDIQDLMKNIDIMKLSTVEKAKLVRTLIDEGILNKKASVVVLREILGGKA